MSAEMYEQEAGAPDPRNTPPPTTEELQATIARLRRANRRLKAELDKAQEDAEYYAELLREYGTEGY